MSALMISLDNSEISYSHTNPKIQIQWCVGWTGCMYIMIVHEPQWATNCGYPDCELSSVWVIKSPLMYLLYLAWQKGQRERRTRGNHCLHDLHHYTMKSWPIIYSSVYSFLHSYFRHLIKERTLPPQRKSSLLLQVTKDSHRHPHPWSSSHGRTCP